MATHFRNADGTLRSSNRPIPATSRLDMKIATIAPIWTRGPSLPAGRPETTTTDVPTILAIRTLLS
eukprot:7390984-Prymnesium_polylepis.1